MQKQRYVRREVTEQPMQPRGPNAQADPRWSLSPGSYTLNSQICKTKSKFSLHICAA